VAATEQVKTAAFKRIGALAAWVVSAAALLAPASAFAQQVEGPPSATARSPRPGDLLRAARDCYRCDDYEGADALCQQADKGKQQLTAAEQKDLADLIKSNTSALKQSRDGAVQIGQANDFLQKGKLQEAGNLVRTLNTNPHLKAADRQQLAQLNDQLKARGVVTLAGNPSKTSGPELPKDYRTLVKMARTACDLGELDKAELYCKKAAEVHSAWQPNWSQPWNDNEDRVQEDVRKQRMQLAAAKAAKAAQTAKADQKDSKSTGKDAVAPQVSQQTLEARALLEQGHDALRRDDLATAKKCADQAKGKLDPGSFVDKRAYDNLVADIQSRQGLDKAVVQVALKTEVKDPGPSILPPPLPPGVEGAETKIADAKNARKVLENARTLYTQNKFDDADRLCAQVAAVKVSPPWGLFEDNPDKLRKDINAARQKADKIESIKLLAEARRLLANGNYAEARTKTWRARQLHGPYNVAEIGDRPDRLLIEIDAAEARAKKNSPPQLPPANLVKDNTPKTSPTGISDQVPTTNVASVSALSAKQRAQVLLEEARACQKQGDLIQAQSKAREAQTAALEAQKAGYGYGPGEESPDIYLIFLAGQAKVRIDAMVRVADEPGSTTDPVRQKKAADSLVKANALALNFGIDNLPIQKKLDEMQRSPAPSVVQTAAKVAVPLNHGEELLDHARQEIRAGRYETARKMAEEAFDAKYGVQKLAEQVLRSIDLEEFEQRRLGAERDFIAAYEAYMHKDYRAAESILVNVDQRLLSADRVARLREIAMDPNMQPTSGAAPKAEVQQLAATQISGDPAGTARATDQGSASKPGIDQVSLDSIKKMDQIQFDKSLKEGLAAQKEALARVNAKDYDGAIEILKTYRAGLAETQLPSEQLARLTPAIDRQIQNYQQRRQADEWARTQASSGNLLDGKTREADRLAKKLEKDAQMTKMMDQWNTLMREHKYQEAYVQAEQASELDPDSVVANSAKMMAKTAKRIEEQKQLNAKAEEIGYNELNYDYGDEVTTKNPVRFDKQALDRSKTRKSYEGGVKFDYHDAKERAIDRALQEKYVTLSFDNTPLQTVVKSIEEYIGDNINICLDHQALAQASIRLDRPLTQHFNNISLRSALNILLKDVELTYIIQNQVIWITTEENARGKQKIVTYNVTDLVVPIENHVSAMQQINDAKNQNQIDRYLKHSQYGTTAYNGPNSLQNGQQVGTPSGGMSQANALGNPPKPTGSGNLDEALIRLIVNTIAPETWSDKAGKGTISYFPLGNALVVNQTQDIQEQIVDLLQALRKLQDLEVAIEMRLVSVSEAFFEYMGVNFDMNITHGSTSQEPNLVSGVFAPNGFINKFQPSSFYSGLTPAGTFTPDLGVPIRSSSFDFATPPFGGFPGTLGSDGGISLGLAFLSDIQVFMFMEAAQGDRRTNTMQAPKITVFNGQTATITVNDELEFLDSIDVNQLAGQMLFTPEQDRVPYGVTMTVTPVVSADRRFVRMNLAPALSNLISATVPLLPVQQIVPQLLYDNISPPQPQVFTMFFQQPSSSNITLNTTVVVPDGGTVLMGGLKTLVEGRNEYGPPVLSKIPYISRLFKNVGYGREAQSLMIMVTARIIINEEEEQEFMGTLPRIPR
jgi:type II secretory pathway component GspD/PulD (secretin)